MTRKQAVLRAIEVLDSLGGYTEEVEALKELSRSLPIVHWDDAAIRDTVEQYIVEHGEPPRASDFRKPGLPPLTAIKNVYGMTAQVWLDKNYPFQRPEKPDMQPTYTQQFIEEYNRIQPKSAEAFDKVRKRGVKSWQSIAKYNGVKTWTELRQLLQLPIYCESAKVHIHPTFHVGVRLSQELIDWFVEGAPEHIAKPYREMLSGTF